MYCAHQESAGDQKGYTHLFERNMRQRRGWGTRPESLEARRPVHSDLGNRAVLQPRLWLI